MSALSVYSSHLAPDITRYITLKQALGRQYFHERDILGHLDRFLVARAANFTAETFAMWCADIGHLTPGVRRNWMRVVRNLCLYRLRTEPTCFVPDPSAFPRPHIPRRPHLFTGDEILRILRAADELQPGSTSPLHREVFRLAVVLLYTAGLRRGELVRLVLADYDSTEQTLSIRASKFHKSRLVPLSSGAAREMEHYLVIRRRFPHAAETPLLYRHRQELRPYTGPGLAHGLRRLFLRAGVRTKTGGLPRVHDLRHSFAHAALLRWYRDGLDVQAKLPVLAVYMGHVSVASTQYYLSFFEPFAQAASERFAQHCSSFVCAGVEGGGL